MEKERRRTRMGRIITIASQKGGVGKTTTALNLGYSLSRIGNRVLVLDGDPQGGITLATNLKKRTERGLINLLLEGCPREEIVMQTRDSTLSVAGIGRLEPEDVFMLEEFARNGQLGHAVKTLAEGFDYLIIDAPAGIGGGVTSFLCASDSVIPVVLSRALSIKSLPLLLNLVRWVRDHKNPKLNLSGVLLTMVDERSEVESELTRELRASLPEELFFRSAIPYQAIFETASVKAVPVGLLTDGQPAARHYLELAWEVKERELLMQNSGGEDEHVAGLF
jgi:chromosome partitioning protein